MAEEGDLALVLGDQALGEVERTGGGRLRASGAQLPRRRREQRASDAEDAPEPGATRSCSARVGGVGKPLRARRAATATNASGSSMSSASASPEAARLGQVLRHERLRRAA